MPNKAFQETRVFIYDVTSDFERNKRYTQREITDITQQPISIALRSDTALDSASITLLNKSSKAIKPFTRFQIQIREGVKNLNYVYHNLFYVCEVDNVSQVVYSSNPNKRVYQHKISLLEATKWLERFDVDNTTITNMLMFLYNDDAFVSEEVYPSSNSDANPANIPPFYFSEPVSDPQYDSDARFRSIVLDTYPIVDLSPRLLPQVIFYLGLIHSTQTATLDSYTITKPDGTTDDVIEDSTYTPSAFGAYSIKQVYKVSKWGMNWTFTYTWNFQFVEAPSVGDKIPQRWSIADVVDKVLSKTTRENSIRRNSQIPLFQLDENQREQLSKIVAPEFTFTQNTLFGILSEIGSSIHAIPRLLVGTTYTGAIDNRTYNGIDWSVIHFDFIETRGNALTNPKFPQLQASYTEERRGDNYTTAFVTNVQNAFVSTNEDYISITEPFSTGFISTRTEESSFEVSNDHACIKVSRPIQRIVSLECLYSASYEAVDISTFVKEKADYDLLTDYVYDYPDDTLTFGLGTKQTNIYFTRGDSVIRGLDLIAPDGITLFPAVFNNEKLPTIKLLLIAKLESLGVPHNTAIARIKGLALKDLAFRIKYVPFLSFKVKQFRENIEEDMETSTLFFNQDAQVVDSNALGERIKGALNMTANDEPTISFVTKTPYIYAPDIISSLLDVAFGQYMPYEIQKEISKKCTITTIKYSKNFNKWNEYIAIKKNYRQYEISEKESIEQNPIFSQFIIIDTEADYDKAVILEPSDPEYATMQQTMQDYADYLNGLDGFIAQSDKLVQNINGNGSTYDMSVSYAIIRTKGEEWQTDHYENVYSRFVLPTTAFEFGNSVVINIATKDNYSAGTTITDERSGIGSGYAMERDIQYGTKYGTCDTIQLAFGNSEFDPTILDSSKNQIVRAKELYKIPDVTGRPNTKYLIWQDALVINKDSRQKINFTMQLNAVCGKEDIWLGSGFMKSLGISKPNVGDLHLVLFNSVPNRFLVDTMDYDNVAPDIDVAFSQVNITSYGLNEATPTYRLRPSQYGNRFQASADYVGYGLIDNNNNVILYYNQAIKKNEYPKDLYLQFREKI